MSAAARTTMEMAYDSHLFLEVPVALRGSEAAPAEWIASTIASLNAGPAWADDPAGLAERLRAQLALLSGEAAMAFLFCPDGLPGDALVEVFANPTDATAVDDIVSESLVALPQRVDRVQTDSLGEGRVVASVAAIPEGAIAALRFQFVARGLLVEVAVTSSDLAVLGAALPIFEQLAAGITFADASR